MHIVELQNSESNATLVIVRMPCETKAVQSHLPVFCQVCSRELSFKTVLQVYMKSLCSAIAHLSYI